MQDLLSVKCCLKQKFAKCCKKRQEQNFPEQQLAIFTKSYPEQQFAPFEEEKTIHRGQIAKIWPEQQVVKSCQKQQCANMLSGTTICKKLSATTMTWQGNLETLQRKKEQ